MKKMLILAFLVVVLVAMSANVALAGGWWRSNTSSTIDPLGTTYFRSLAENNLASPNGGGSNLDGSNPHGNFTTSTNLCKTCHAVHLAGTSSWRLLKSGTIGNGDSQANECVYCHGTSGVTGKKPLLTVGVIRGEHNTGATGNSTTTAYSGVIPDSTSAATITLSCNSCHSVHNNDTLSNNVNGIVATGTALGGKLLRVNPNGDGGVFAVSSTGSPTFGAITAANNNVDRLLTAFCSDCHTRNPNWDTTTTVEPIVSMRPNPQSHVQGPGADGTQTVNGTQKVARIGGTYSPLKGCEGCHNETGGNLNTSSFPHISASAKFLMAGDGTSKDTTYTAAGSTDRLGGADRTLTSMDAVCLNCHRWTVGSEGSDSGNNAGVGINGSAGF